MADESREKKKAAEDKIELLKQKLESASVAKFDPKLAKKDPLKQKPQSPANIDPKLEKKDSLGNYLKQELSGNKNGENESSAESLKEQISSVTGFFSRKMIKGIGGEEIIPATVKGLNPGEILEVRKLVHLLKPEKLRYTKKEIFESMILENKNKKIAMAVIKNLYPE